MARINTNIASMIAQSNLTRTNQDLQVRLERLSTGLRINRGADDPAGLIVSERLRSEIRGLEQAIRNTERAGSVIATAEGYLAEVADLLNSIKALAVEAASTGGVSQTEIEANQLQVDSAIDSITRIANTASFNGLQLLNGALEYHTQGIDADDIQTTRIHSAHFGNNATINVQVQVLEEAKRAEMFVLGTEIEDDLTIEIAGNDGVQVLSFTEGTSFASMRDAINSLTDSTGVRAVIIDDGDDPANDIGVRLESVGFGTDQFVSARKIGEGWEDFATLDIPDADDGVEIQRAEGGDVRAIVNGARAEGKGLKISVNVPTLSLDMRLSEAFGGTPLDSDPRTSDFTITGGGAKFQIGSKVNTAQQVGLGVPSITATRLGGTVIDGVVHFLESIKSGQENSLVSGNAMNASRILEEAIQEVSVIRGRLGAFERNTLQTNARALQIGVENISASESVIRDTDFARETAALTRAQILSQAGTSVLATANINAQNVLALLG
jgi:flagellin